MSDISKLKINGVSHNIKDSTARTGLSGKQDTLVSGTNIKTVAGQSLLGSGNIDVAPMVETTWAALKALRDGGNLVPGMQYRITDYQCTTVTTDTASAGHQFDIIVVADSESVLNENARAALHAGDTYFANNDLAAWELKYCLDNDSDRFAWADTTNGKGVIHRMKDEFNNDVPYDFKNILFTDSAETPKYTNAYTFSYTENSAIKDASLLANKGCYNNTIKKMLNYNRIVASQLLNFNVFYSTTARLECYSNIIGNDCRYNTFGNGYYHNIFGNYCVNNTFGNNCQYNTFGNYFYMNTFGNSCQYNAFGNNCSNNTFGTSCKSNTFGNNCSSNTFGNDFQNNAFGNYCFYNTFKNSCKSNTFGNYGTYITFGNSCSYNTLGDYCSYNTFGDSSSAIDYCRFNIIDNGCKSLYITGNGTASSSNYLQNVHIHSGVVGPSSSNRRTITVDRGLAYSTDIYANGSKEIILND